MYEKIKATAENIKAKINIEPKIGIVCGSGLANIVEIIKDKQVLNYSDIINFPLSTVKGHKSNLIFGEIASKNVVAMQGRFHFYEGYPIQEVVFGIRVMKALGVETVIITNAAGGMNPNFRVGDIMIIKDHINLLPNPLIGHNDERLGTRFPSMNNAYSEDLILMVEKIAKENNIDFKKGVYLGNTGPSFETPSEYKFYNKIGADCVGMSTTAEVITAVHSNMKVFGMSLISNVFDENNKNETTHEEVIEAAKIAENNMMKIVEELISQI